MASHIRRITIEEYENGGFGIMEYEEPDIMGLSTGYEVISEIAKKLEYNLSDKLKQEGGNSSQP
jgi:hypothetical protein